MVSGQKISLRTDVIKTVIKHSSGDRNRRVIQLKHYHIDLLFKRFSVNQKFWNIFLHFFRIAITFMIRLFA